MSGAVDTACAPSASDPPYSDLYRTIQSIRYSAESLETDEPRLALTSNTDMTMTQADDFNHQR